jgi:NAD(P)-dependent dehydrogenase (short-subunit alcohol dehydrogenase family)
MTPRLWSLSPHSTGRWISSAAVVVNAIHPGAVRTRLGSRRTGGPVRRRGWPSPEGGADGPLRLATAPELAEPARRFFERREETPVCLPPACGPPSVRTLPVAGAAGIVAFDGH